jgi:hypothetical protein
MRAMSKNTSMTLSMLKKLTIKLTMNKKMSSVQAARWSLMTAVLMKRERTKSPQFR